MYTLNFKDKPDPRNIKLVKIEIVFYKSGYPRVTKVISITGYYKDWHEATQTFTEKSVDLINKNKLLTELKLKYLEVAEG